MFVKTFDSIENMNTHTPMIEQNRSSGKYNIVWLPQHSDVLVPSRHYYFGDLPEMVQRDLTHKLLQAIFDHAQAGGNGFDANAYATLLRDRYLEERDEATG